MSGELVVRSRPPKVRVSTSPSAAQATGRAVRTTSATVIDVAGLGTSVAARGVQKLVDKRIEQARTEAARETREAAEWRRQQHEQYEAMTALSRQVESGNQAGQLGDAASLTRRTRTLDGGAQARGFLEDDPVAAKHAPDGESGGFRELVARAESLLEESLLFVHLGTSQTDAAVEIRQRLTTLLTAGSVSADALDTIEQQLADVRQETESVMAQDAYRPVLVQALTRHMTNMKYSIVKPFSVSADGRQIATATLRIPGGEQVGITLQPDGSLAFEFRHERHNADHRALDEAEQQFARQQEARLCRDLDRVVHQLVADGFSCEVAFEREIPTHAISVVQMEKPSDWQTGTDPAQERADDRPGDSDSDATDDDARRRRRYQQRSQRNRGRHNR